jgi:hypothetical protein
MSYNQERQALKKLLKEKTGKDWRVFERYGDTVIMSANDRLVDHFRNPQWNGDIRSSVKAYTEIAPRPGDKGYYMPESDCVELAKLLWVDTVHMQGYSFHAYQTDTIMKRIHFEPSSSQYKGYTITEYKPDHFTAYLQGEPKMSSDELAEVQRMIDRQLFYNERAKSIRKNKDIEPLCLEQTCEQAYYCFAKFPRINKQDWIIEYHDQLAEGEKAYHLERVRVCSIVWLEDEDYLIFCDNLMNSRSWLDGLGGTESLEPSLQDIPLGSMTRQQIEHFRQTAYVLGILVVNQSGTASIIVNPEGRSYACYLGFEIVDQEDGVYLASTFLPQPDQTINLLSNLLSNGKPIISSSKAVPNDPSSALPDSDALTPF